VVEEGRRSLSSIFKGTQIEEVTIEPYELQEVMGENPRERPRQAVFRRLGGDGEASLQSGQSSTREGIESGNRERIDQREREAYEKAFKLGETAGVERGEHMFRSAIDTFVEAAKELKRTQIDFYHRVEGEILDLVLATTRKVVEREMDSQKDMVLSILKEAIAKVINRERIHVRINPSDFDFVQAHKSDIVQSIEGIKHLVLEKDEGISRGGVVVETDHGTIDARIERRFAEVEKALRRQTAGKSRITNGNETAHGEKEQTG